MSTAGSVVKSAVIDGEHNRQVYGSKPTRAIIFSPWKDLSGLFLLLGDLSKQL